MTEVLEFESFGAHLAYDAHKHGLKYAKELLAAMVEDGGFHRQGLEQVANELQTVRLFKLASLVRQYAEQCADAWDMRYCPYLESPYADNPHTNQANIDAWIRSERRRYERRAKQRGLLPPSQ